ncbi:MAG: CobQ/CobB/MinD/ParA nucleotide binding domain-containing protein [Myxococcales bacterium]|nr:CobQ/CobB/MinD/ParA nucleotide binding domain-containing protein [Myxococcales bacterium]
MRSPGPKPTDSTTHSSANVLVIGADTRMMGQIREVLGTEAPLSAIATPFNEAMAVASKTRPDVVIAAFDTEVDEAIRIAQQLKAELPRAALVAVAHTADADRTRAAMRAGYDAYVVLPDGRDLLRQAVHDSMFSDAPKDDAGELITVWGAKGGVGATFVAVNLAAELSPVQRVCVLDMDVSMGDVAAMLNLYPRAGIKEVFKNLARLDERMLRRQMTIHPSMIHVLAQPKALEDRAEPSKDSVIKLLTTVAKSYHYVFLDSGSRVDEAAVTAATLAKRVLLVSTPDVLSVKNAWRRLQLLQRLGVDQHRISLVLNRVDHKHPLLTISDIEQNLGRKVDVTLSEDRVAGRAVNDGKLLREYDRHSQIARDFEAMTGLITEGKVTPEKKPSVSVFTSIFKMGG